MIIFVTELSVIPALIHKLICKVFVKIHLNAHDRAFIWCIYYMNVSNGSTTAFLTVLGDFITQTPQKRQ
jgi:hypothetical protein